MAEVSHPPRDVSQLPLILLEDDFYVCQACEISLPEDSFRCECGLVNLLAYERIKGPVAPIALDIAPVIPSPAEVAQHKQDESPQKVLTPGQKQPTSSPDEEIRVIATQIWPHLLGFTLITLAIGISLLLLKSKQSR